MPPPRLAVDIGGIFTDLALEHDGRRATARRLYGRQRGTRPP